MADRQPAPKAGKPPREAGGAAQAKRAPGPGPQFEAWAWGASGQAAVLPAVLQRSCACGSQCTACRAKEEGERVYPELMVSAPGDRFEREADAMALRVLHGPPGHAGAVSPASVTAVHRETDEDEDSAGEFPVQPKAAEGGGFRPSAAAARDVARLRREGTPLPDEVRADMESRFGRDFSAVRIHTGGLAHAAAVQLQARAFTVANHVAFRQGAFSPASAEGRRLLAHELTHVAQQGQAPARAPLAAVSPTGTALQREPESSVTGSIDPSTMSLLELQAEMQRVVRELAALSYPENFTAGAEDLVELYGYYREAAGPETDPRAWDLSHSSQSGAGQGEAELLESMELIRGELAARDYPRFNDIETEVLVANYQTFKAAYQQKSAPPPDPFDESEFDVDLDEVPADFAGKLGIVKDKGGANLRLAPATEGNSPLALLPLNTRFVIDHEAGEYYHVTLEDGREGFVFKKLVTHELPDPDAQLYEIKTGDTALGIVKQFYKGDAISWGQDERFYVNVLVWTNEQAQRPGIKIPKGSDDWSTTQVFSGMLIWIPGLAFAQSLKGVVSSGSISYEIMSTLRDIFVGTAAFVAGLLLGALKSIADLFIGIKDLVVLAWKVVKSLLTGNIISDVKALMDDLSKLSLQTLIDAVKDWFWEGWNTNSTWDRWKFIGQIVGYAIAEILMLVFSGGIATAVKWAGKSAKLAALIAKFPKIQKMVEAAKAAKAVAGSHADDFIKAAKATEAFKTFTAAHEWARRVLRIPLDILVNVSEEAAERLKKLPAWAQARFRSLNHFGMKACLGCASPCRVDVTEVLDYLKNLAPKSQAGAKALKKVDDIVLELERISLATPVGKIATSTIRKKLSSRPALLKAIQEANLTDLDLAKIGSFLTAADHANPATAYRTFVRYITAVVPAKTGGNIDELNRIAKLLVEADARQGAALKGAMFEQFGKIFITELGGNSFMRVTFKKGAYKLSKSQRTVDNFVAARGEIWEIKHSFGKVPTDQADDYSRLVGLKTPAGDEIKSVNYLFPDLDAARANRHLITDYNFNVYYVEPGGSTLKALP
ncbi:MAG: DUF4157 domain-containing protein [Bryobacterales bacterium]|nr:DUF4157 domain-containing protein [Bryobacterales bacterium]